MSFSIKKQNNDITYISQNLATTNSNTSTDNWSENGNNIYNNNTGNVGINTSNPLYNLDVSGNINIRGQNYGSVLYTSDINVNLTINSPNTIIIFGAPQNNVLNLPDITSSNNGLTFSVKYFSTFSASTFTVNSNSSNIYSSSNSVTAIQTFNNIAAFKIIAFNGNWYFIV